MVKKKAATIEGMPIQTCWGEKKKAFLEDSGKGEF